MSLSPKFQKPAGYRNTRSSETRPIVNYTNTKDKKVRVDKEGRTLNKGEVLGDEKHNPTQDTKNKYDLLNL